ncbi:MAG TPA: aminopeptidase [Ardenticatenaceae bacterium]|jgi:aminopeptidase
MADSRIKRVAQVLVEYSVEVKPGDWVVIRTTPEADTMTRAIYKEVLKAGGNPQVLLTSPWEAYLLLKNGNDDQLDYVSPTTRLMWEQADVQISILAASNTKSLSNVDPARDRRRKQATSDLTRVFMERSASGALRWVATLFPTNAFAQDAEMSLEEYEDFVYGAGLVDEGDPVQRWQELGRRQQQLVDWLAGRDQVHIRGADADLRLSIKERTFINAEGKRNFPDGEIFTGPVEHSANGWVRFTYPAVLGGREVTGIEFTFEEGKVVKASATKNEEALLEMLETDPGARFLGELGIGTNPGITRFTRNTLFDEKIQGTFHLAVGMSYPDTGGVNQSGIHEDIVCDLKDGEITVDGELFYRNGEFVV